MDAVSRYEISADHLLDDQDLGSNTWADKRRTNLKEILDNEKQMSSSIHVRDEDDQSAQSEKMKGSEVEAEEEHIPPSEKEVFIKYFADRYKEKSELKK